MPLTPETPVFATTLGGYTHPDNLSRAVNDVCRWSAGRDLPKRLRGIPIAARPALEAAALAGSPLPAISPHDLRHSCATMWLRKGVPLEVVSKWLGHSDISTTLKHYRHVLESEKREHVIDFFPEPAPAHPAPLVAVN